MTTSINGYRPLDTEPGVFHHLVRVLGVGAGDPTKQVGRGITVTRVAAGKLRYTWADGPGAYLGFNFSFQATTQSDLKGYTVVAGEYDTTNKRIDLWVYDSTFTLADLAALQKLFVDFAFKTVDA